MLNRAVLIIGVLLNFSWTYATTNKINSPVLQKATFAGGCFWCMEPPFEKLKGVKSVISGYAGGKEVQPKYKQVASGQTGHKEVVQVIYDSKVVSYQTLLQVFWRNVDPLDSGGQFVDRGLHYTTAIFYHSKEQKQQAEKSKQSLIKSLRFKGKTIVTPIISLTSFYPAEKYHQDYYKKNPFRYKFYRLNSGRDKRLKEVWGKELEYKIKK